MKAEQRMYKLISAGYIHSVVLLASVAYELRELREVKNSIIGKMIDEKSVLETVLDGVENTAKNIARFPFAKDRIEKCNDILSDTQDIFKRYSCELDYLSKVLAEDQDNE